MIPSISWESSTSFPNQVLSPALIGQDTFLLTNHSAGWSCNSQSEASNVTRAAAITAGTAGRRNAAEEGGDVAGAVGPLQQDCQQVRKSWTLCSHFRRGCVTMGNFWVNKVVVEGVLCWIILMRWHWIGIVVPNFFFTFPTFEAVISDVKVFEGIESASLISIYPLFSYKCRLRFV